MFTVLINMFEKLRFHILTFFALMVLSTLVYKWVTPSKRVSMPASPPRLPIIGHLHLLGKLAHHSLSSLSHKYGDLMLLYLGNKATLIVSSASAVEKILKTHDLIFANKAKLRFVHRIFYDGNDVAFGSYGEKWRRMKGIYVLQLLSNKRVQSLRSTREEEVGQLIQDIKSYKGSVMNLSETLLMYFKGLVCRSALGRNYTGKERISKGFHTIIMDLAEVMMEISLGDYIPYLSWVDKLTGLEGRAENIRKQFDAFIEEVIQKQEGLLKTTPQGDIIDEKDGNKEKVQNFMDVLLAIHREDPKELTRENIKAIILDIISAGPETSSVVLEWAMTELFRHPKITKRLQEEVRCIVKDSYKVTEDELEKMKYLKAVIKETLRLHPPSPLLTIRESSQSVKIDRYEIGVGTRVIINVGAIHRDPKYWKDPEGFDPNRFLDNNSPSFDFGGQHLQYIPFGAGRRGCPGAAFSIANIELVLANFIHQFNWTLINVSDGKTLDVQERPGIIVGRQNPLFVIATPTRCPL